jgi:hypothetical protein
MSSVPTVTVLSTGSPLPVAPSWTSTARARWRREGGGNGERRRHREPQIHKNILCHHKGYHQAHLMAKLSCIHHTHTPSLLIRCQQKRKTNRLNHVAAGVHAKRHSASRTRSHGSTARSRGVSRRRKEQSGSLETMSRWKWRRWRCSRRDGEKLKYLVLPGFQGRWSYRGERRCWCASILDVMWGW